MAARRRLRRQTSRSSRSPRVMRVALHTITEEKPMTDGSRWKTYGDHSNGPLRYFTFQDIGARPSWRRFGQGIASINFMGHRSAGWLTISSVEGHSDTKNGRTVSRETIITLDTEARAALADWLSNGFETPTPGSEAQHQEKDKP